MLEGYPAGLNIQLVYHLCRQGVYRGRSPLLLDLPLGVVGGGGRDGYYDLFVFTRLGAVVVSLDWLLGGVYARLSEVVVYLLDCLFLI
jgi:hypothetical protein